MSIDTRHAATTPLILRHAAAFDVFPPRLMMFYRR